MTRSILIDEFAKPPVATPYDTENEAFSALRERLQSLIDDPEHNGVTNEYLGDCCSTDGDGGPMNLNEVSDDHLNEWLSDIFVMEEGAEGVWTNFSSADRWSVCGILPDEKPFGNADTRVYRTADAPSGSRVRAQLRSIIEEDD